MSRITAYTLLLILAALAGTAWPSGVPGVSADAESFFFSTGLTNGLMAMASRPSNPPTSSIEAADDFLVSSETVLTGASFIGLLPSNMQLSSVLQVRVEIFRVYPKDSGAQSTANVPTRVNSPSDVLSDARDSTTGSLSFTASVMAAGFTANNSVLNGINKVPNQTTGGEGFVTGEEVQFNVNFGSPFLLPKDHYFFVPQVRLSSGVFYWLSAPKPITGGTSFNPDLQTWIRNAALAPDWLRVGTDIVGAGSFNAAFSLSGTSQPIGTCAGGAIYRNVSGAYTAITGAAHDLGANGMGTPLVWAIGTNITSGGCGIYQYVGGSAVWTAVAGGATSITVDSTGNPWALQSGNSNAIFRRTGGSWSEVSGAALELSGGIGGDLVAIGADSVPGGHSIYQYVGPPAYWSPIAGAAEHIAVAPDHSLWAAQSNGDIYHFVGGTWTFIPGKAQRLTVGADGTVYALGLSAIPGGYTMYRYVGGSAIWQAIAGGALEIIGAGTAEFWAHQ